jgi:hypothetical protein
MDEKTVRVLVVDDVRADQALFEHFSQWAIHSLGSGYG